MLTCTRKLSCKSGWKVILPTINDYKILENNTVSNHLCLEWPQSPLLLTTLPIPFSLQLPVLGKYSGKPSTNITKKLSLGCWTRAATEGSGVGDDTHCEEVLHSGALTTDSLGLWSLAIGGGLNYLTFLNVMFFIIYYFCNSIAIIINERLHIAKNVLLFYPMVIIFILSLVNLAFYIRRARDYSEDILLSGVGNFSDNNIL